MHYPRFFPLEAWTTIFRPRYYQSLTSIPKLVLAGFNGWRRRKRRSGKRSDDTMSYSLKIEFLPTYILTMRSVALIFIRRLIFPRSQLFPKRCNPRKYDELITVQSQLNNKDNEPLSVRYIRMHTRINDGKPQRRELPVAEIHTFFDICSHLQVQTRHFNSCVNITHTSNNMMRSLEIPRFLDSKKYIFVLLIIV